MKGLAVALWLAVLGGAGKQELTVTRTRAAMMEKPQYWGRTVTQVSKGQKVVVVDESRYPWLKVEFRRRTGWLHASNFAEAGKVNFAGAANREAPTEISEKSLGQAARGLTPEMEKAYVGKKPELKPAFDALDLIEQTATAVPDQEAIAAFVRDGGLMVETEEANVASGGER